MLLQISVTSLSLVAASLCKSGGGMLLQILLKRGGMVLQTGRATEPTPVAPTALSHVR